MIQVNLFGLVRTENSVWIISELELTRIKNVANFIQIDASDLSGINRIDFRPIFIKQSTKPISDWF